MNGKTAKLIQKYAATKDEDKAALRRRWVAMNHLERRVQRQRMLAALAKAD